MMHLHLRLLCALALLPGCVFCPDVAQYGYTPCDADVDCAAGRFCDGGLCAPPPWNDASYGTRQLITVTNPSDVALPVGTAVAVRVGGDGVLALSDVGADGRFTDYNRAQKSWRTVPVFRDVVSDRYTAWLGVARAVAPGATETLAWVEGTSDANTASIIDDRSVFDVYDGFDGEALLDSWRVTRSGGVGPRVANGVLNIADNQAVVLQQALLPPVALTFVLRVNGVTCDEVFVGLVGHDDSIFNDAPSAGLFVSTDLSAELQVAPTTGSLPQPVGSGTRARNAFVRLTIAVDRTHAVLVVDDGDAPITVKEDALRPPFDAVTPMYVGLQVGGACSIDVDSVWSTAAVLPMSTVAAEPKVQLNLAYQ